MDNNIPFYTITETVETEYNSCDEAISRTIEKYLGNKLHCLNGPAIQTYDPRDGRKIREVYYEHGNCHRDDGRPADITFFDDGNLLREEYFVNGKRHNENGVAIVSYNRDGSINAQRYYLNDELLTHEEWLLKTSSCDGKIVEIDGKQYRLTEVK